MEKVLRHRKLILFYFIGCSVVSLGGCDRSTSPSAKDDKKLITEISAARAKAFNEGDAAGITIHFTPDALLMAPDKPVSKGSDAVQAYYQSIFDVYTTRLESHYEEIEVSGNLAYGRGEAVVTLLPKRGGPSQVSTAKYLNILKKQPDGTWKTTHDIWNANE